MPPTKSKNLKTDQNKKARQAAIDYGIDVNQMDYILSLTPAERNAVDMPDCGAAVESW